MPYPVPRCSQALARTDSAASMPHAAESAPDQEEEKEIPLSFQKGE
jgi:hypothetical protein